MTVCMAGRPGGTKESEDAPSVEGELTATCPGYWEGSFTALPLLSPKCFPSTYFQGSLIPVNETRAFVQKQSMKGAPYFYVHSPRTQSLQDIQEELQNCLQ